MPAPYATDTATLDAILERGGSSAGYTTDQKNAAMDQATMAFEQAAGVAFASRSKSVTLDGPGGTDLLLPDPKVTAITAASISGIAVTLADIVIDPAGVAYLAAGWAAGRYNVALTYTYGYTTTPTDVSRAVAVLASSLLADGPFDDRGYIVSDEGGALRLLTAGVGGAYFSIPEVEAALRRYRIPRVA